MLIEICLSILAATAIILLFVLIRIYSQAQRSIHLLQTDIHDLSKETIHLLNAMNEFVRVDLHAASKETCQLISKLNDLSSDINDKSHSLNFLFKPLNFLSSKLDEDSPSSESSSQSETIPQILNWVVSSARLFNTAKELIKNHGKRTQ
jgi:uncharacterized protein YoxC